MKAKDWYIINSLLLALVSISLLIIVLSMPTSYTPALVHNKENVTSAVGELSSIEFSEDGKRIYVTKNNSISIYILKKSYDVRTAEFNKSIEYQSESFSTPENETWENITLPTVGEVKEDES